MKTILITVFSCLILNLSFGQDKFVTYVESDAFILNPSRGFYNYTRTNSSSPNPLDSAWLANSRVSDSVSIIFRYVYMDTFLDTLISASFLESIEEDFSTLRKAGFKVVLRFAYTSFLPDEPPYNDSPSKALILEHIEQLRPILQANVDVILTLQNGFWGVWGENFFSDEFGTDYEDAEVTPAQWLDRKEITDTLLSVMPEKSIISLRYPELKANFYELTMPDDSLTLETAHNGGVLSRLGYHNDCFLVAANDFTFGDIATEKPFWETESKYTIMGGETCGDNPTYANCENALIDLENAHWTYINNDYHPDVLDRWQEEGCYSEIQKRLGYRFVMESGNYDTLAAPASNFLFDLRLNNIGFASTVAEKEVNLVFKNGDTSIYFNLDVNTRFLFGNESYEIEAEITLPSDMPLGAYSLYLQMTDIYPSLQNNTYYAIRFANVGTWDAANGINDLGVVVDVTDDAGLPVTTLNQYSVYPNPSSNGIFTIVGGNYTISNSQPIYVYDLLGNQVGNFTLDASESSINLSHLSSGIYLLKIDKETIRILR